MMASEHRTNVGIAELLLVSVQTIENYRAHICIKLGLSSSHALSQGRVSGLEFTGGIFTNITHDHLDYHNSFKEYLAAKKSFYETHEDE